MCDIFHNFHNFALRTHISENRAPTPHYLAPSKVVDFILPQLCNWDVVFLCLWDACIVWTFDKKCLHKTIINHFLPLDLDFINENASIAKPDPRIASIHKSRFATVLLMECWMEAVYYYVNGKTLYQLHTRDVFYWVLIRSTWTGSTMAWVHGWRIIRPTCTHAKQKTRCCRDWENNEFLVREICYFMVIHGG